MPKRKGELAIARSVLDLAVGFVTSVEEAGGTIEDARRAIFKSEILKKQLGLLVMGKLAIERLTVWRTIMIGAGPKDGQAYMEALRKSDCTVDISRAVGMVLNDACVVANEGQELDLVIVSGFDLGFDQFANRADIYMSAYAHGLELCPAEVGPALRLQYSDQPENEHLVIAMEAIGDLCGKLRLFFLTHGYNELGLSGYNLTFFGDDVWNPGTRWVFVLPRK